MEPSPQLQERMVLLKIQNGNKPDQLIHLVYDSVSQSLETEGLSVLFGVKEIRIPSSLDVLQSLQEYAEVISFLLETMSAAQDYNLPYAYNSQFEFGGVKYSLEESDGYRVLKRM